MKLCFLAHSSSIHTRRLTGYFEGLGHDLSLISFSPGPASDRIVTCNLRPLLPVSYHRTNWHYLFRLLKLRRCFNRIQPDLIFAQFLSSYGLMAALARPRECFLVIRIQGSDLLLFPKKSALHAAITRFAIGSADLVILPAAHMEKDLKAYGGRSKSALTVQYGIDLKRFHPGRPNGRERQPVCFSNRAMLPASGVDTILEAAALLESRGSALTFHLADAMERSAPFQKKARKLALGDTVMFLGSVDPAQMPSALRRAAIYISMVPSDGASLSLMEAMACGLFPVVADIPANREWVDGGVNGFLVPLGRPDILADRLQQAWEDGGLRHKAASINWDRVRQRCDYTKNMQKIEAALMKLVKP
jgi:glycosyltransferase involved in cell wall biosynthesis